tara:strand:+ start:1329 stop:1769 length:441 start_codon:yes stop_codon:yes gene_type:complete
MNLIEKRFKNISDVISFYLKFDKYKNKSRQELFNYLLAPFNANQCKIFYRENETTAFVSWCFLDKVNELNYKKNLKIDEWNCGERIWLVDLLSTVDTKKMVQWTNNYFTELCGVGKKINYLKLDINSNCYRVGHSLTKRFKKKWEQ